MNIQSEFDFSATGGFCSAPSGVCAPPVQAGGGTFLQTKTCSMCKKTKSTSCFYKNKNSKDGLFAWCSDCAKKHSSDWAKNNAQRKSEYQKKYWMMKGRDKYIGDKESSRNRCRKYRITNKENVAKLRAEFNKNNANKIRGYRKKYRTTHRNKLNDYFKNQLRKNPTSRLLQNMRTRIWGSLRGKSKSNKTKEIIGCSIEYLWSHLESMFSDGMTRENYGKWHVDHIKPCASFDLSDPEQQRECFNYKNLQPLWAEDNLKKWCRIIS